MFKAAGVVVDDNGVGEGEGEEGGLEEEMESLRVIYEEEDALALEPLVSPVTTIIGQPSSSSSSTWRPTHRLTLRGGMPPSHCLRVWLALPGYPSAASGPVFALAEGPRARAGVQVGGWVGV